VVAEFDPEKEVPSDARLVIPFYDEHKELFALQGRVLSASSKEIRYITVKKKGSERVRVYGLDTFDKTKPCMIVEGPLDSLFLPNCLALAGSSASIDDLQLDPSKTTFVFDNERRSKQIIREMNKRIDEGFSLCVWPDSIQHKDINDMVKAGLDPLKIIAENTKSGLSAKAAISTWSRV
jgi:hypothetical protein